MTEITTVPPYTNRGAQRTQESGLRACVDWVQATFKIVTSEQLITDILQLKIDDFYEAETGKYGYRRSRKFGHISIYYDGRDDMGIHLEITGQGCREYESLKKKTWKELFFEMMCYEPDVNITRIDVAIDDFKGYFKISGLIRKIKNKELISKFKSATRIEKIDIETGESKGNTIYYGSSQSRIQIRMYEKDMERIGKGHQLEEGLKVWNRTEVQARDERAKKIAQMIMLDDESDQSIGEITSGILKYYLRFTVKGKDSNRRRWNTAKFWDKFIGDVEELRLTDVAPDKTIEKKVEWIDRQVSPSLAVLFHAFEGDMDVLKQFILNGSDRLTEKDYAMIQKFKEEQKNRLINGND